MIPFILAAVGGYLIGDSFGKEINSKIPKFADGGDVDARKTYLYIGKKYDGYYVMVSVYNQPNLGGQILESGFTTATEAMDFAIDKMYQFRLSKNHVGFADDEAKNGFHSEFEAKLSMPPNRKMADGGMAKGGMTKSEIADEVKYMKRMLESCYTYGSIDKGSYYYEKYILPYKETLGKELFDKVYKEESKRLKNYEVVKDVHTDAEGVSYNQLKHKK